MLWAAACTPAPAPADGSPGAAACRLRPDDDTVALYAFEDEDPSIVEDALGGPSGTVVGPLRRTRGTGGCGRALTFVRDGDGAVVVPADQRFDLPSGAIELLFRPFLCGQGEGGAASAIVTRGPIAGEMPGHLLLGWDERCRVVVRLRGEADAVVATSAAELPIEAWHSLAVRFGPGSVELWQNGTLVGGAEADDLVGLGLVVDPWVFGAHAGAGGAPLTSVLGVADLDAVRIRRRRDAP
ncbi:MAG: hypothetical protein ACFCGT_26115 [Sandaracinaceae bacterium]